MKFSTSKPHWKDEFETHEARLARLSSLRTFVQAHLRRLCDLRKSNRDDYIEYVNKHGAPYGIVYDENFFELGRLIIEEVRAAGESAAARAAHSLSIFLHASPKNNRFAIVSESGKPVRVDQFIPDSYDYRYCGYQQVPDEDIKWMRQKGELYEEFDAPYHEPEQRPDIEKSAGMRAIFFASEAMADAGVRGLKLTLFVSTDRVFPSHGMSSDGFWRVQKLDFNMFAKNLGIALEIKPIPADKNLAHAFTIGGDRIGTWQSRIRFLVRSIVPIAGGDVAPAAQPAEIENKASPSP